MVIGMDKPSAVKADNCCGEKFFDVGIVNKLQATSYKGKYLILMQFSSCPPQTANCLLRSQIKLIPHPFYSGNAIQIEFLAYLSNMYINGSVANDHFGSPNLV